MVSCPVGLLSLTRMFMVSYFGMSLCIPSCSMCLFSLSLVLGP
jgi:hypothetical protein